MKAVKYVVFRYLTDAEFFNIYKPRGAEEKGGGQRFIDFPTTAVSIEDWLRFFGGVDQVREMMRKNGPRWEFNVNSIGLREDQEVAIYQRRHASVIVAAQNINSSRSGRIRAWHPQHGFPRPVDPSEHQACPNNLVVYIVRTASGEFWAGWLQDSWPCRDASAHLLLEDMLPPAPRDGHAGFLRLPPDTLLLDEGDAQQPFCRSASFGSEAATPPTALPGTGEGRVSERASHGRGRRFRSEAEVLKSLFEEDSVSEEALDAPVREVMRRVVGGLQKGTSLRG